MDDDLSTYVVRLSMPVRASSPIAAIELFMADKSQGWAFSVTDKEGTTVYDTETHEGRVVNVVPIHFEKSDA